jgi:hypothetical protein
MEAEPADQFFTNLLIYNLIQEKQSDAVKMQEQMIKNGQSS